MSLVRAAARRVVLAGSLAGSDVFTAPDTYEGAVASDDLLKFRVAGDENLRLVITAGGKLKMGSGAAAPLSTAQSNVVAPSATIVGQIVQGAVLQTANLLEWKTSAGVVRASMGDGILRLQNGLPTVPTLTFEGDINTGLYAIAPDDLGITVGAAKVADFKNNAGVLEIGFFGAAPVIRQAVGAAATDAATTQTLANNLRTALINLGLATT